MEVTEYKLKLKILKEEYDTKLNELHTEFAMSNNNVHNGDVFTDHIGSVKVDRIEVTLASSDNIPSCVYYGFEVKKDGTPKKRPYYRLAYQINEVKK
jgi:hypothetical protein